MISRGSHAARNAVLERQGGRFQEQLSRATLQSERLRATVLVGVYFFAFVFAALSALLFETRRARMFGAFSPGVVMLLLSGGLVLYELVLRQGIGRRIARGASIPWGAWYVNAFLEISALSAVLAVLRQALEHPVYALTLPAVMAYFTFIILSTLRLEFKLGVFTGLVAAVEYLALALHTLATLPVTTEVAPLFHSPFFYVQKAVILLIGGFIAAFVAHQIRLQVTSLFHSSEERDQALVEKARLQGEHTRQRLELEEARHLQLSMLPGAVPTLPGLDFAVHMQTASEVGGDYYDFHVDEDGTLTMVIGDATGHGMQAGLMVAITKGLFETMAGEPDLLEITKRATRTLRRMKLHRMYMAMTLARYKDHRLQLVAAGMPRPLLYRSAEEHVEYVEIKGMPLGGVAHFPYARNELVLQPGDTVLFMSDGLPELPKSEGERLGDERVKALFQACAGGAPAEILQCLRQAAAAWSGGPVDDDLTLLVMKIGHMG